jgi:hypothetical protein
MTDGAVGAPHSGASGATHPQVAPRVLLFNVDRALVGLLDAWLAAEGCVVFDEPADGPASAERVDLVIVDVPFPRQGGADWSGARAVIRPRSWPCPDLRVSNVRVVARELAWPAPPKPTSREALTQAVRRMLSR